MNVLGGVKILAAACVLSFAALVAGEDRDRADQSPLFRVGVETVFVKVAVTDPLSRSVVGLEKDHFKVFEEKVQQEIVHFTQQPAPISVGILFDTSGSMKADNNIGSARNAIVQFLHSANPQDEFFLITFNQSTSLAKGFTSELAGLRSEVAFRQPGGRTALYDAVYMGLDEIREGRNEKKALILITDGEDNSSRYSSAEVREFAKESDVQIYAIGEEGRLGYGRSEIQNIVALTGGRAFFPNGFNELDYYIELIHSELRHQYVIGYVPSNRDHDGKWRKIQVKLEPPRGLPQLIVHAKEGYYAPRL